MLNKVLIIDDSELVHHLYRLVLHRYGCQFADAMNGREALEIIEREEGIDLILLDIDMPVLDGLGFMEAAAPLGICRDIPVIVVGAWGKEREAARAATLGAVGCVARPFSCGELHALIEKSGAVPAWLPAQGIPAHLRMGESF